MLLADFVCAYCTMKVTRPHINKQMSISKKHIVCCRSEQNYTRMMERLFMKTTISTGLELTPTPLGVFTVFKPTPSRYMQGPLPWLVGPASI